MELDMKRAQATLTSDQEAALEFKRAFFWQALKALEFNQISGDYVEFGSHGGRTFRLAYDQIQQRQISRHMWAFDSFRGLPKSATSLDSHPVWQEGAMATGVETFHRICQLHGIPSAQYSVVEGFYEEVLPGLPENQAPQDIAFAYIDCDMYSSTRAVLDFLAPRLKHGMVLAFDDYFCWSSTQVSGERKAFVEFAEENKAWHFSRYREYGWAGLSFIVESADLLLSGALDANEM